MKIQLFYPNGYAPAMNKAREENQFDEWISAKFGNRIRALITDDFSLDIQPDYLIVDFPDAMNAHDFYAYFGGHFLEE